MNSTMLDSLINCFGFKFNKTKSLNFLKHELA